MNELINATETLIENHGTTGIVLLSLALFMFLLFIIYLAEVIESYSRSESLINMLKYKKYKIFVTDQNNLTELYRFRAFGTIHAAEKLAKKLDPSRINHVELKIVEDDDK